MSRMPAAGGRRYQRGLSLVELMIAMVIGLVLILGVTQALVASRSVLVSQASMASVAENARVAFELMTRELRMAGLDVASGGWVSFAAVDESALDEADRVYNDATVLSTTGDGIRVEYWVNGAGELMYRRDGAAAQPLLDGINSLDVHFAIRSASSGLVQYVDKDGLSAADPSEVIALQLALALRDPDDDGSSLRVGERTITTTLALRNPLLAAQAAADQGADEDSGSESGSEGGSDGGSDSNPDDGESGGGSDGGSGSDDEDDGAGDGAEDSGSTASCTVTVSGVPYDKTKSTLTLSVDGSPAGTCTQYTAGSTGSYSCTSASSLATGTVVVITDSFRQNSNSDPVLRTLSRTVDCGTSSAISFTGVNF